jgi:Ca2+-binding RTX toxin-like protein
MAISNVENYGNSHVVRGTSGNDIIEIRDSRDGEGVDIIVNGKVERSNVPPDQMAKILIDAGAGDDVIYNYSSVGANIQGGKGSDTIVGSDTGDDVLDGGDGIDVVRGRGGDDKLVEGDHVKDSINGGTGIDEMIASMAQQGIEEESGNNKKKGKKGGGGSGIFEIIGTIAEKVDEQLKNVEAAIDAVDTSEEANKNGTTAKDLAKVQIETAKLGWFGQTWQTVGQTAAQIGEKAGSAGKPG